MTFYCIEKKSYNRFCPIYLGSIDACAELEQL